MLLHSGKNNNNIPLMVYLEVFDVKVGTLRPLYPLSSVRRRIKSLTKCSVRVHSLSSVRRRIKSLVEF